VGPAAGSAFINARLKEPLRRLPQIISTLLICTSFHAGVHSGKQPGRILENKPPEFCPLRTKPQSWSKGLGSIQQGKAVTGAGPTRLRVSRWSHIRELMSADSGFYREQTVRAHQLSEPRM
jgi:hypothetical protein